MADRDDIHALIEDIRRKCERNIEKLDASLARIAEVRKQFGWPPPDA